MLFLVLGKGKTGSLVAEVARERGHSVRALDITENESASALTAPISPVSMSSSTSLLPKPPLKTCAPCSLSEAASLSAPPAGMRNVDEMRALAIRRQAGAALWNQLLHRRAKTLSPHRRTGKARGLQILHRRNAPHIQARRPFRHRHHAAGDHSGGAARRRGSRHVASRRRRQR